MPGPTRIATTEAVRLHALSAGGQRAIDAYPQIAAHLRRARGPDHAALFAEPVPDRGRGTIDWYVEGEGVAAPIETLPDAERAAAEARLAALVSDIEAEATALEASDQESDRLLGQTLAAALRLPDRTFIRVLGGRPVLVGWAHEAGGASIGPERLTKPTALPPGRMAVLFPALGDTAGRWRRLWLWLALPLALLLLLLLLLLWWDPWRWFALSPPSCVPDRAGLVALEERRREEDRTLVLRGDLGRLALEVGQARLACPPIRRPAAAPAPPPPPVAQAEPPRPNPDLERARREGARDGDAQVVLAWDDENDLDLAVICPDGTRIFFENRRACGAELDLDMNVSGGPRAISRQPAESITWAGAPPPGTYRIEVTHYARNPGGPATSPFRVTIRRPGQPDQVLRGQATAGQTVAIGGFRWPP